LVANVIDGEGRSRLSSATEGPLHSATEPLVSVGIFNFNQAEFLPDCLKGLEAQDYGPIEVFLVDDGSADGSLEVLRSAAERIPNAKVIADGTNIGLAGRIGQVVDQASGEWLMWVAADDWLLPAAVETLVSAVTPEVDVIWGDLRVVNESGESLGYSRPRDTWQGNTARKYLTPAKPLDDIFRVNNFITGGMSLIRREAVVRVGGYPPELRLEDLNMWLTLGVNSNFRYVGMEVGKYRVVADSHSHTEERSMPDLAMVSRRHVEVADVPRSGLARLVAMRWCLGFARTRGRPPFGLPEYAHLAGLKPSEVLRELPRAGFDPIWRSLMAWLRRSRSIGRSKHLPWTSADRADAAGSDRTIWMG
jgi:glycosyltransferase involved in cell wall biosynthesis